MRTYSKRLLVFEGLPGAGKTTLLSRISTITDIPIAPRRLLNGVSDYLAYNSELLCRVEDDLLLDRFIWSDVVFSKLRGQDSYDSFIKTKEIMKSMGVGYILFFVISSNLRQTHSTFSDTELTLMKQEYDILLQKEVYSLIDYSKLTFEDAVKVACEVINDK